MHLRTWSFLLATLLLVPVCTAQDSAATAPPTVKVAVLKDHATKKVKPIYPAIAKAAHVSGTVVVGVEVDASGKVTTALILSGPEMLRAAALDAAKQWEFRPIEVNGGAATVRSAIPFTFTTNGAATSVSFF